MSVKYLASDIPERTCIAYRSKSKIGMGRKDP
jgi:hypothetical protein